MTFFLGIITGMVITAVLVVIATFNYFKELEKQDKQS